MNKVLRRSKANMVTVSLLCHIHRKKCNLFCNDCNEFFCDDCDSHRAHAVFDQQIYITQLTQELKSYSVKLKSKIMPKCSLEIEHVQKLIAQYDEGMQKIMEDMKSQHNKLCENVDLAHEHLKWQFQKICEESMHHVYNSLHDLQNQESVMKDLVQKCESIIRSGSIDQATMQFYKQIPNLDHFVFDQVDKPTLPDFAVGTINLQVIKNNIGHLGVQQEAFHIEVETFFQTNMFIEHIACVSEELVWIGKVAKFCLVTKTGVSLHDLTIQDCVNPPFTLTRENDVIFSNWMSKEIKKISKMSNPMNLVCTAPYTPHGICITNDGDIVVCLVGVTKGKLVKYASDSGHIKQEILCTPDGQNLFKRPEKVTENYNCHLCVIDMQENKLIVVDKNGQLQFDYHGNNRTDFQPSGLCCDKYCNILVSDYVTKAIDIINFQGVFLISLQLTKYGLSRPMGIDIDKEGKLWIGQGNGYLHVIKYLR